MLIFRIASSLGTTFKKVNCKRLVYFTNMLNNTILVLEMFVDCLYSNKVAVATLLCRLVAVAVANSGATFSK